MLFCNTRGICLCPCHCMKAKPHHKCHIRSPSASGLLGMEVHRMSTCTPLHGGWWVLCGRRESHQDVGDCKKMHGVVYIGLAVNRGPSLCDSAQGCHHQQGSIGEAESSKVSHSTRNEDISCSHRRPGRAGCRGGDVPPLGSVCMEVPATLEGECCFLKGVQPVPPWDEGPCDVFPGAQMSPAPLEQRKADLCLMRRTRFAAKPTWKPNL